jgi:hypothetical protein
VERPTGLSERLQEKYETLFLYPQYTPARTLLVPVKISIHGDWRLALKQSVAIVTYPKRISLINNCIFRLDYYFDCELTVDIITFMTLEICGGMKHHCHPLE